MSDPDLLSPALKALSSVLLGVAEPAEVLGQILDAARVQTEAESVRALGSVSVL